MTQTELPFSGRPASVDLPFKLTNGQEQGLDAVDAMMRTPGPGVTVLAGFAGTGKTTLLRVIAMKHGVPIVITPTGKAALRVREATGLTAQTIHRWLYKPIVDEATGALRFARRYPDEIETAQSRLVLLDEASMVGVGLWKDVHDACQAANLNLVCVGDPFQLPPVDPTNPIPFSILTPEFAGMIGARRVELTEILRQAQDSPVIRASMALRAGQGIRSFQGLQLVPLHEVGRIAMATYQAGGVTICHRNVTRFQINAGMRAMFGIRDEQPQVGEPLLILKNTAELGFVNGESVPFGGWKVPPLNMEIVRDRYKNAEETARFGAATFPNNLVATLAIEELNGRLVSGMYAIAKAAAKWARLENLFLADNVIPHLHAHFGYAYTAHKSQGSEWPYVLVILEPSIRLHEEEGRRWAYTALTRASLAAAVHIGALA